MSKSVLVIALEGTPEEITEDLNKKIREIEEKGGEVIDLKISYSREHGVDGFVIVYTLIYREG